MTLRPLERSTLRRWAGFGLWFAAAGILPVRLIHPVLQIVFGFVVFAALLLLSRRIAFVPWIVAWHERTLRRRVRETPRVTFQMRRAHPDLLLGILVGGLLWMLPLATGAHALANPSNGASVAALAVFTFTAAFVFHLIVGRSGHSELTMGEDGIRLSEKRFIPYSAIDDVSAQHDHLALSIHEGSERKMSVARIDAGQDAAPLLREELLRRSAIASASPEPRRARDEANVDGGPHFRVADVPSEELVTILRDGTQARSERVRVAKILAVSAPEEVQRLVSETADEQLAQELAPFQSRTNGSR